MSHSPTAPARRTAEHGPVDVRELKNARRLAIYIARRQGIAEPLLQLWRP